MLPSVAVDLLLFGATCLGMGLCFATFLRGFDAADRLSLGIAAAVIALYLAGFARYLLHLPPASLWLVVAGALAALGWRRRAVRELWRDESVPRTFRNWAALAVWCLGWQALVFSYSGGGWSGDWQEHYDRALFFLQQRPVGELFIGTYSVPARPPLANLVIGCFLGLGGSGFHHFQVFSTLLATIVYFPMAGLVHRILPGARPQAVLLVLVMFSPLFIQNATFPWTKLPAAFFIVLAASLCIRPPAPDSGRAGGFALVAAAAALLTHYSAAPWIIALGVAWLVVHRRKLAEASTRQGLLLGGLAGSLLFFTWLGWSLMTYGATVTFTAHAGSGSTPTAAAMVALSQTGGNVYRTLVPAWLWEGIPSQLQQSGALAGLRDRWFYLYQLNLPLAFGLGGVVVLGRLLLVRRDPARRFWSIAVPLVVVVSAAVNPAPDSLGLTHIVLQPLVLLGLAWLAARADTVPATWRRLWAIGLACDFVLGIALHFGVQSLGLDRWLYPGHPDIDHIMQLSQPARANYFGKLRTGAVHLADGVPPAAALLLLTAGAAFALTALYRSARPRPS